MRNLVELMFVIEESIRNKVHLEFTHLEKYENIDKLVNKKMINFFMIFIHKRKDLKLY